MTEFLDVHLDPLVSPDLLLILAGLSLALLLFSALRKGRGLLFRALFLTALLTLLANPSVISETRQYLNDTVLLIFDESDSQKYGDRTAQQARAKALLNQKLTSFKTLDIQTATVQSPAPGADLQDEGTQLFKARRNLLKTLPSGRIAATILVTDGQVHDVPSAETPSLSEAGPVHVLLTGQENEKDRVLFVETAPAFGIVNKDVTARIKVTDQEENTVPKTIVATVHIDGTEIKKVAIRTGRVTDISLPVLHGGANFVEIRVPELEGELAKTNNAAFLTVNGIRDRLKVLLVSGEPHMGERGWRNILKSDPSVELVHFTILRPPEKQDGTPINELSLIPFPIAELFERKLEEFDLIIFDRYRRRGVLSPGYLNNIVNYVEKGGALLEAAGPAFATPLSLYRTPLAAILPGRPTGEIHEEGYVPTLNANGEKHPVTALLSGTETQTNWGRWFRMIDAEPDTGTVLMTGPAERPLLILERRGKGRVAQLLSDHAWLWGHGFEGGGPQSELLRRLSHWLMKEPELEEERLFGRVSGNRLNISRRSLAATDNTVTIQDPDGVKEDMSLEDTGNGLWTATMPLTKQGLYTLQSGDLKSLVAVGRLNPVENQDVRSTADKVSPVTDTTDGGIFRLSSFNDFPDFRRTAPDGKQSSETWMGLRDNRTYEVTGYDRTSLSPPLLALLILMGSLCFAWWREGR